MMKNSSMESRRHNTGMKSDAGLIKHRISVTFAITALLLMGAGFAVYAATCHSSLTLPGNAAIPLEELLHPGRPCFGLVLMSAGIIVLGLQPGARVLLSLLLFMQRRAWANVLAAVGVLLVLLFSASWSLFH